MHAHHLLYTLDLFGTAVFALSGALAAGRQRMDIFGVLVLALVTALGGGTLRDALLDSGPVFWVHDRSYLAAVVAGTLGAFAAVRAVQVPRRVLLIADAIGLATFTLVGAVKALQMDASPSIAVIMGIVTGVAGGMLRDILSAEVPLILRREIYATACLCGGLVYVVLAPTALPFSICAGASMVTTLTIRLTALRWRLSLPRLDQDEQAAE